MLLKAKQHFSIYEAGILISLISKHDVAAVLLCTVTIQDLSDLPTLLSEYQVASSVIGTPPLLHYH